MKCLRCLAIIQIIAALALKFVNHRGANGNRKTVFKRKECGNMSATEENDIDFKVGIAF